MGSQQALMALARQMLGQESPGKALLAHLEEYHPLPAPTKQELRALLAWHQAGQTPPAPPPGEVLLANIAPKNWDEDGRDHWLLIHHPERGLVRQYFFQDRSVRLSEGWAIRDHFPVLEETALSAEAATAWLETLLEENVAQQGHFIPYKWTIHWNGWPLPQHLHPAARQPLLTETLRRAANDPNFYFHNGPASTFGLHPHFGENSLTSSDSP